MADLPQAQPLKVTLGCATSKQVALGLPYCFHDCEPPMFLVDYLKRSISGVSGFIDELLRDPNFNPQ